MGAYWLRRVVLLVESMPSFDFVLVKKRIKTISAEQNSVGIVFAFLFAVMTALTGLVRGRKEETAAFAAVAA